MAFALVDSVTVDGIDSSSPVTSSAIDTTGATLLVVSVSCFNSHPAISDSKGNSYTVVEEFGFTNAAHLRLYVCLSPTVGSGHTFTVNNTSQFPVLIASAWSSSVAATVEDSAIASSPSSGTTLNTGNVVPGGDNRLIVSAVSVNQSTITEDGSLTLLHAVNPAFFQNVGGGFAYEIQTTGTTRSADWSWGASDQAVAAIAALQEGSGGGAPSGGFNALLIAP